MTPVELRALIDTRVASDPAFAALVEARQAGDVTKDRAIAEALSASRCLSLRLLRERLRFTASTTPRVRRALSKGPWLRPERT